MSQAFADMESRARQPHAARRERGPIVGCLQLVFIPGLSRQGAKRAIVESVRVTSDARGQNVGTALMKEAIAPRARSRLRARAARPPTRAARARISSIAASASCRAMSGSRSDLMTWRATVLTLFPEMFPGPLGVSLLGRARQKKLWSLDVRDIREHGLGKHRTVDDTPSGGGPGMVMRADVACAAIDAVERAEASADLSLAARRAADAERA